jgi:ribulose bisphosphate carboxylase small subunit
MKEFVSILLLIAFGLIPCKAKLISNSTFPSHALLQDSLSVNQVKKIIPKGYIILTESGAREALKAKVDASSYLLQLQKSKEIIAQQDTIIHIKDLAISEYKAASKDEQKAAKILKRKLFFATLEKWSLRILVVYLGSKQILN